MNTFRPQHSPFRLVRIQMNEREIFIAALQYEDKLARATCVAEASGDDDALRERIEFLLKSYDEAGGFLKQPAEIPDATFIPDTLIDEVTESTEDIDWSAR